MDGIIYYNNSMATISVPLSGDLERALDNLVKSGYGANKADVVRKALKRVSEDEAVNRVLKAEQELLDGKSMKGDLRELIKIIK